MLQQNLLDCYLSDAFNRAVANGPVGPAMAGPIIGPVIFFFYFFFIVFFCPDLAGIIVEPVILFDILF